LSGLDPEQFGCNFAHKHLRIAELYRIASFRVVLACTTSRGSKIVPENGEDQAGRERHRMIHKQHVIRLKVRDRFGLRESHGRKNREVEQLGSHLNVAS